MRAILLNILAFAFLSSCQTAAVYTDKVTGVNFENFKSYSWLPAIGMKENSPYANNITITNVQNAVNEELQGRGLEINNEDPDLLVYVHLSFSKETETIRQPVNSTYPYYDPDNEYNPGEWYTNYYIDFREVPEIHGYDIEKVDFTEGTVVVDVISRNPGGYELIWRGWTENRIFPEDVSGSLIEGIEDIFDRFPLKPNK